MSEGSRIVLSMHEENRWRLGTVEETGNRAANAFADAIAEAERSSGVRPGQRFLISSTGEIDVPASRVFGSVVFLRLRPTTQRDYAVDILDYVNFLASRSTHWSDAEPRDLDDFEFRRLLSRDPTTVSPRRWNRQLAAIKKLYAIAERNGIKHSMASVTSFDPVSQAFGRPKARTAVRWMSVKQYYKWRDVGLRGLTWSGDEDTMSRSAMSDRNTAFADLLFGTGLRSAEAHVLTIWELDASNEDGKLASFQLAPSTAKGGREGRRVYLDAATRSSLARYVTIGRRRSLRRAKARGIFEDLREVSPVVVEVRLGKDPRLLVRWPNPAPPTWVRLSDLGAHDRSKLLVEAGGTLEPAQFWLGIDGRPLTLHSWQQIFEMANQRVRRLAPNDNEAIRCHPHMLRHTFAMRHLFAARQFLDRRFNLSADERRDYAHLYGNAYAMVRDLLGHASAETTKSVYLASVTDMEVRSFMVDMHEESGEGELDSTFNEFAIAFNDSSADPDSRPTSGEGY